jgi:hypothetical protein
LQTRSTRIGQRSVLVVVLIVAAVVGWVLGSWLGSIRQASTALLASASAAATQESSLLPSPLISPVTSASAATPPETILEIDGSADEVSDPFTVLPGWQVLWSTEGGGFALAVRGDQDLGAIVTQNEAASGATTVPIAGTFHVEVTAKGPWSIKVIQGTG